MPISSIIPYLIAYLLGVATPIVVALLMFRGQDDEHENSCLLIGLLVVILAAVLVMTFLWAKGGI